MNYDLKGEIYSHLTIDELSTACQVDKESISICSSKKFWENYFNQHQLQMPKNVTFYKDWIKEFYIAEETNDQILGLEASGDSLLKMLRQGYYERSSYGDNAVKYELDNDIDYKKLFISSDIDNMLIKFIDNANQLDLSYDHIKVLIKYEPNKISLIHIEDNVWKMAYELLNDDDAIVLMDVMIITKDEVRKYLTNVLLLDLAEIEI